jgi:hypothetical protein
LIIVLSGCAIGARGIAKAADAVITANAIATDLMIISSSYS